MGLKKQASAEKWLEHSVKSLLYFGAWILMGKPCSVHK